MEHQFTLRNGLYVANQISDEHRPDVFVDCLLDKGDGSVRSAYGIVYENSVIELYHLLNIADMSEHSDVPEFEIVLQDTDKKTKRFYKVVFDHEETFREGGQA